MALTLNNNLNSLKVGDYFWCKYTVTTANTVGVFSDIATKTDAEVTSQLIPVASSNLPNGYFKFIMVEDWNGKKRLVADRNIQHSISWDVLNTSGIASGSGLPMLFNGYNPKTYQFSIRLLTGGISATDKDNEWDKHIVNSNLDGNITAGDNGVWNFSGLWHWTSTTYTTNTDRVFRGGSSSNNAWNGATSNGAGVTRAFRPLLEIEDLIINKSFILLSDGYKKYVTETVVGNPISSENSKRPDNPKEYAFDGNISTSWQSLETGSSVKGISWIGMQFSKKLWLNKIKLSQDLRSGVSSVKVQASNDGIIWNDISVNSITSDEQLLEFKSNEDYFYWRVLANNSFLDNWQWTVYELEMITSKKTSFQTVSPTLPTLTQFQAEGMDDLSVFDRKVQKVMESPKAMTSEVLGVGKVYKASVDLKKIFDLRKLEVK